MMTVAVLAQLLREADIEQKGCTVEFINTSVGTGAQAKAYGIIKYGERRDKSGPSSRIFHDEIELRDILVRLGN